MLVMVGNKILIHLFEVFTAIHEDKGVHVLIIVLEEGCKLVSAKA